jgi:hypothetical protein
MHFRRQLIQWLNSQLASWLSRHVSEVLFPAASFFLQLPLQDHVFGTLNDAPTPTPQTAKTLLLWSSLHDSDNCCAIWWCIQTQSEFAKAYETGISKTKWAYLVWLHTSGNVFFAYLVLTYLFVFQLWNIKVSTFGDWQFCVSCTDTGSPHMRMQWIWLPVCQRLQLTSTVGMCTCFFCKCFWVLWVQFIPLNPIMNPAPWSSQIYVRL